MNLIAFAAPIPADQIEPWHVFVKSLNGNRRAEFAASRNQAGVRERDFHQSTPQGDIVIVTWEGNDPAGALAQFARQTDPFATWFRSQILEIHGVDIGSLPGPLPELVADSNA